MAPSGRDTRSRAIALALCCVMAAPRLARGVSAGATGGAIVVRAFETDGGRPVRIANVHLVGEHRGSLVDSTGAANIPDLPPGRWLLRSQVLPRALKTDTVRITARQWTHVDLVVGPPTAAAGACVIELRPLRPRDWSSDRAGRSDWRVVSARPATPQDAPPPRPHARGNAVPGPGSLRAVVRDLEDHHPSILIEDSATGESRLLLEQWASGPQWSPDGRWIACSAFGSMAAPYDLTLVEVASGRIFCPHLEAQAQDYQWSPDSKRLAVSVEVAGGPTTLGCLSPEGGTFVPVDTLGLRADYEFSWSPDSRTLAVSKPTHTDAEHEGEVTSADLWLIDATGARRRVVAGRDFIAGDPQWVDSTHVRYTRSVWTIDDSKAPSRTVLELARRP